MEARNPVSRGPHSTYFVPDDRVLTGASHGNSGVWVHTKATGAIEKFFSIATGCDVFESITVTYGSQSHRLIVALPPSERAAEEMLKASGGHVTTGQVAQGTFEFHRAYQRHRFRVPGELAISETFFVPRTGYDDPAVAYIVCAIRNAGSLARELVLHGYAALRGTTKSDVMAHFNKELGALVAHNESKPLWVRVFGCTEMPSRYQTMHHAEDSYDSANVPPLTDETKDHGNIVGALAVRLVVPPQETRELAFVMAFSPNGAEEAAKIYSAATDFAGALKATERFYERAVCPTRILTPERTINDGAMWAKVNMLRVIARYPQGLAFTNTPGASSAVVGRDLAWFTIGCDYLDPEVSRAMLLRFAQTQAESGKLPEFYNGITGETNDYGLNINDDTPLFVHACAHHYQITGNDEFLDKIWPVVQRATDYMLAQRDKRGLVVCTAKGENVHGICGWRNIIPNATISGAVTEVNAECYQAIRRAAWLAACLAKRGDGDHGTYQDARTHYDECAAKLRDAINTHLINPRNGMYVLNVGPDGDVHADVTGDEVFPVMFGVAPEPVAYRIISRLNNPDFQTDAGLRTVSRLSPDYTPYDYVGLLGGVWPGLSFWYAFAAAKIYPDTMVHNLQHSYAQYLRDPKIFNTVPGQFSEWFDGESLVNRGMRLSPWEPPRYLWAAIEGACGLGIDEGPQAFKVTPLMPSGWSWLAARDVPLCGRRLTFFVGRASDGFQVYATDDMRVSGRLEVYERDVSDEIERLDPDMETVALRRGDELLLCLGSTTNVAFTFPVTIRTLRNSKRTYTARLFDSTRREWITGETAPGDRFAHIAVRVDAQGYCLIRLEPQ